MSRTYKITYRLTGEDADQEYCIYEEMSKFLFEKGKIRKASPGLAARHIVKRFWKLYIQYLKDPDNDPKKMKLTIISTHDSYSYEVDDNDEEDNVVTIPI